MLKSALFAALFLVTFASQAQPLNPGGPRNLGESVVTPGQALYPIELANSGVQGTTIVEGIIQVDGALSDLKVAKTSRSETLDQNALLKIKGWHLKESLVTPEKFTISIGFMKDSLATLKDKTCSDFMADFEYFTITFPELPAKKMPLISSTGGLLVLVKPDVYRTYAKREESIIYSVVDQCRKNPTGKYLATFLNAVQ